MKKSKKIIKKYESPKLRLVSHPRKDNGIIEIEALHKQKSHGHSVIPLRKCNISKQ